MNKLITSAFENMQMKFTKQSKGKLSTIKRETFRTNFLIFIPLSSQVELIQMMTSQLIGAKQSK